MDRMSDSDESISALQYTTGTQTEYATFQHAETQTNPVTDFEEIANCPSLLTVTGSETLSEIVPRIKIESDEDLDTVATTQGQIAKHVRSTTKYSVDELARILYNYQEEGYLCDTVLVADNGELRAHSAVLAAASQLLKSSLAFRDSVKNHIIVLSGVKLHVLKIAAHFIYTGDVVIPSEHSAPDCVQSIIKTLLQLGLRVVSQPVRNTSKYTVDELAKTLYIYQQTGYLCDTLLVAEDGQLAAHSAVLAAASPFFKSSLVELGDSPIIQQHTIPCCIKLHVLKIALHFIYTGNILIPPGFRQPDTMRSIIATLLNLGLRVASVPYSTIYGLAIYGQMSEEPDIKQEVISSNGDTAQPTSGQNPEELLDIKPEAVLSSDDDNALPISEIAAADYRQVPMQSVSMSLVPLTVSQQRLDNLAEFVAPAEPSICVEPLPTDRFEHLYHGMRLCEFCGKLFIYSKLIVHLSTHTGQKNFVCTVCEKRYASNADLVKHMRGHTQTQPYVCELCNKSYRYSKGLNDHRFSRHALGPKVLYDGQRITKIGECHICKRQFIRSDRLRQHMRSHTGEKPFECTKCACKFAIKQALVWHMRRHTGETPYLCEDCGCSFSQPSSYYGHLTKHHGYQKKHRTPPAARIISTVSTIYTTAE